MPIELNGQNDIVRRNGNLPDEVVATKAGPSLTAEEVAYLESLPPQSTLKQAYLNSTAKTELQAYQVSQIQALVSGAGIADASSLTLTTANANTSRIPAGTQTYTVDGSTGWSVSDGIAVWLPASGTVSFAVSGGPTLNGGTSTLTRTLAGNSSGYVVLNRIAATAAYYLSGA